MNFIGIYTFSFFAIGALFPLLGQYLASIGFNGVEIGVICSSSTAIGILSSPLLGSFYEKRNNSKKVLYSLYALALALVLMLMLAKHFAPFLVIFILAFFFEGPIRPLNDAMTLSSGHTFGKVRKWGSVGFALGVFIAGILSEKIGLAIIFPMYSVALLATMVFIKSIKLTTFDNYTSESKPIKSGNFKILLKNKKYMALIWSAFFINGTMIAQNTYFSFLFIQVGGTFSGIGLALLLMVGSEVPMMAWSEKLSKIIPMEKLILITMFVSLARFLWYSTAPSPELLTGTFFTQGIANGVLLVMLVKYISKTVDKSMISSAITLYAAISSNASAILCLFFGGVILESFSGAAVYLFYGVFNLVGIFVYVSSGLLKTLPSQT